MIAVSIQPTEAEQALTSAFLAMLPPYGRVGSVTADIARDQALDLVAVSLAKAMDGEMPRVSSARALVFVNVRAAIEAGPADPALDAATVAAAAGLTDLRPFSSSYQQAGALLRAISWRTCAYRTLRFHSF